MQEWFHQAKLGIFIHYGIYAVDGVAESWSFYNNRISYKEYMSQISRFTAKKFDPQYWADLIVKSGAKYSVITAKHHDGVALYDTKYSDLSTPKQSQSTRDIVKEFTDAIHYHGLKNGIYFSLIDWSHPDYPSVFTDNIIPQDLTGLNPHSYPTDGVERPEQWEKFMEFNRNQLKELFLNYGPIDLLWFDGDWERSDRQWQLPAFKNYLLAFNDQLLINSRLGSYGDYHTPEQGIPLIQPNGAWEFCTTINTSWGHNPTDNHYKTPQQVIQMFCDCLSMGGNMLLNIGPKEDGTIDHRQEKILLELGTWISQNQEAVYTTTAGLQKMYYGEGSTLSLDHQTIYLFVHQSLKAGICLKGLRSKIKRISILSSSETLSYTIHGGVPWFNIPGTIWIQVNGATENQYTTVIKVELTEKLELYDGQGVVITEN